ncbi:MAG: hypothetical protein ACLTT2_00115 [Alphaproteobacteria bacterium]
MTSFISAVQDCAVVSVSDFCTVFSYVRKPYGRRNHICLKTPFSGYERICMAVIVPHLPVF